MEEVVLRKTSSPLPRLMARHQLRQQDKDKVIKAGNRMPSRRRRAIPESGISILGLCVLVLDTVVHKSFEIWFNR